MTNRICHRVIAISRIFLKDQWKFLPWWLLSKSEYNVHCCLLPCKLISHDLFFVAFLVGGKKSISLKKFHVISQSVKMSDKQSSKAQLKCVLTCQVGLVYE